MYTSLQTYNLPGSAKEEHAVAADSTRLSPTPGGWLAQWLQLLPEVRVRVEPVQVVEVHSLHTVIASKYIYLTIVYNWNTIHFYRLNIFNYKSSHYNEEH